MHINNDLKNLQKDGLFRKRRVINSAQGSRISIEGETFLNFSSNDYLGFADDEELKQHMIESVREYGIGAGSSQLMTGYIESHQRLEAEHAAIINSKAALIFSSG